MRSVWAASLMIAAAVCGWLFVSYRQAPPPAELTHATLVFIGSSLTLHAFPAKSPPEGLLGDGQRHARLTRTGASERRSTEMLRAVLDVASVRSVYVEIYPYIAFRAPDRSPSISIPWISGSWELADAWSNFGDVL